MSQSGFENVVSFSCVRLGILELLLVSWLDYASSSSERREGLLAAINIAAGCGTASPR